MKTKKFAEIVKNSTCYFVLITRERLATLPYSCKAIYELSSSGNLESIVNRNDTLYRFTNTVEDKKIDCIVTEDEKAGYEFYKSVANHSKRNIECISSFGNSNLADTVKSIHANNFIVIGDGAAIGPYYEELINIISSRGGILWVPESFEYVILKSSIFNVGQVAKYLASPYMYVESSKYFSWERFFTYVLMETTKGTELEYNKNKLNPVYLSKYYNEIKKVIPVDI